MSLRIFDDEAMYLEINHAKNLDVQIMFLIDSSHTIYCYIYHKFLLHML